MSRRIAAVGLSAALTASFAAAPVRADACAGTLCAGAARADITPPVGTPMWGYSARAFYADFERWAEQRVAWADTDLYAKVLFLRSEGVHTRLFARAFVLKNRAGVKMALVQTDLGAVTGEVHAAVAKAVAPLGIARDFLLVSATHTHGGPGAMQQPAAHGLLVGDHYDPRVFKRVVDGIARAVTLANARLAPARVGIRQGRILGASVNRSMRQHAAGYRGFGPNPCPDPDAYETDPCTHPGENEADPHAIDPWATVIRVDRADGVPLGVWTSFAAHGTMFWSDDMRFSGDNQGYAARMIEEGIAARASVAPGEIVAAYANGTEGDIAPAGSGPHRFARAEDSGRRQARAVLEIYDSFEPADLADDVVLDARWNWLNMLGEGGTSPVAILGAGPDCPFGTGAPWPDEGVPGHGRKCPFLVLSGTGPQWFGLQVLRIGGYVFGSVPGEMTVQMGRRIKKRMLAEGPAGTVPVIVGLANDYMAYISTPDEYDVQDYEATFTLWGRAQGPLIRDRIGDLADRLFTGRPNPPFDEPPDTSDLQFDNASPLTQAVERIAPGRAAGTVIAEPQGTVERGVVASLSWLGGAPSAEVVPDVPFAETQRLEDGAWRTVFWDEGYETILDYWREGTEDRWGVQWDVPLDAPTGRYRFLVHGRTFLEGVDVASNSADVVPYEVTSEVFDVVASDDVSVTSVAPSAEGLRVRAAYPPPLGNDHPDFGQPPPFVHLCSAARGTATCNFRWRPPGPETPTATVVALVDGAEQTGTGSRAADGTYVFPSITGSDVEVLSFTDGHGNTT